MRLTHLMVLGPLLFVSSPFSASLLSHLLRLPQVLRGNCKRLTDYFSELIPSPLVNSIITYEVE